MKKVIGHKQRFLTKMSTDKDIISTVVTTRKNVTLSNQITVGKGMVKRQSKGSSRNYAWG